VGADGAGGGAPAAAKPHSWLLFGRKMYAPEMATGSPSTGAVPLELLYQAR
jgi:hypothetical protein